MRRFNRVGAGRAHLHQLRQNLPHSPMAVNAGKAALFVDHPHHRLDVTHHVLIEECRWQEWLRCILRAIDAPKMAGEGFCHNLRALIERPREFLQQSMEQSRIGKRKSCVVLHRGHAGRQAQGVSGIDHDDARISHQLIFGKQVCAVDLLSQISVRQFQKRQHIFRPFEQVLGRPDRIDPSITTCQRCERPAAGPDGRPLVARCAVGRMLSPDLVLTQFLDYLRERRPHLR